MAEDRISRTAGNVYERGDKPTWMIFPEKSESFVFVDAQKMLISDEPDEYEKEDEDIDVRKIIQDIQNVDLGMDDPK